MNIIKRVILVSLFCLVLSNLLGIDKKGIKVGYSFFTITGNNIKNVEFQSNFSSGFFITMRLANWLKIQPELLLSSNGANFKGKERFYVDNDEDGIFDEEVFDLLDNDGDGLIDEDTPELYNEFKGSYKLYYFEIPIILKFNINSIISKDFKFLLGPSFNILTNGKYKLKTNGSEYIEGQLTELKTIDICGKFGCEYSFGKYSLELRANYSFIENRFKSYGDITIENLNSSHFDDGFDYPSHGDPIDTSNMLWNRYKGNIAGISMYVGYTF